MFRPLRYGVGAYLPRIMVQERRPFQQIGTGVSHSKRCGRTGCDHWSCDFLFWDLFLNPSLYMTFRIIFLAYLYGQLIGFTLTTLPNYMMCREETLLK